MNCSQNSTPATKKLPCISQMWMAELLSPTSNGPGRCQTTITMLKIATLTHGRSRKPPAARSGFVQPAVMTSRVAAFPDRPGRPSSSGCHGAPATMRLGAANMSSRCWIMCTKK